MTVTCTRSPGVEAVVEPPGPAGEAAPVPTVVLARETATPAPSSRRSATDPAGGPAINTEELTILLHRSVWSVGQVTRGAPEQDTN